MKNSFSFLHTPYMDTLVLQQHPNRKHISVQYFRCHIKYDLYNVYIYENCWFIVYLICN